MTDVRVVLGECKETLRTLADGSCDSLVTDPPAGASFMGKTWDSFESLMHFQNEMAEVFTECLRVLKPGAHGLVWALPRTSHHTGMALERAGFEIRDHVSHIFATGMPKGQNISKAFDKMGGASAHEQAILLHEKRDAMGLTREALAEQVGCTPASIRDWEEGRARASGKALEWIIPSAEYRDKLASILAYSADERQLIGTTTKRVDDGTVIGLGHSGQLKSGGHTELSKKWGGWNTTLKPAHEVWWLVRKPVEGTIAGNVLVYGTGAINVDGCRVDTKDSYNRAPASSGFTGLSGYKPNQGRMSDSADKGRWPANVVLSHSEGCDDGGCVDGCQVQALDEQSGKSSSSRPRNSSSTSFSGLTYGMAPNTPHAVLHRDDSGGASRFFYTAKVPPSERKLPDGTQNVHPTAKSIKLMRYFVRLITPPGGVVLDPFMGSGTTGVAAKLEGMSFLGIEREPEYHRIAQVRLEKAVALAESVSYDMDLLDLALSDEE
jgi:transcriptional regulator with XRE-family HTH domain